MDAFEESTIELSAPDAPADVVFDTAQRLIAELNQQVGPIASRPPEKAQSGSKGAVVSVGQIILTLSSAIAKQAASSIVEFIKRNPRYAVQVGKIKITKDYASENDVAQINLLVRELTSKSR